ncbi:hypothetical protein V8054_000599 [Vibrio parahaemolyticus]
MKIDVLELNLQNECLKLISTHFHNQMIFMSDTNLDKGTSSNKDTQSSKQLSIIAVLAAAYIIFGAVFHLYVEYQTTINEALQVRLETGETQSAVMDAASLLGTRGDYFGGLLNPFLAFLSFIALLYTIRLQMKELEMTREELAKTAEANKQQALALTQQVEASKEAAESQKLAAKQQQFDTTFSTLLAEHNKSLSELSNDVKVQDLLRFKFDSSAKTARESVLANGHLCKYYRMLYQVLKFIARNHPDNTRLEFTTDYLRQDPTQNEKSYASLVRSMIPANVLTGLAANCSVLKRGESEYLKYILLIERYAMLEHLDVSSVAIDSIYVKDNSPLFDYLGMYEAKAFGSNSSVDILLREIISLLNERDDPGIFDDLVQGQINYVPNSILASLIEMPEVIEYKERALLKLQTS